MLSLESFHQKMQRRQNTNKRPATLTNMNLPTISMTHKNGNQATMRERQLGMGCGVLPAHSAGEEVPGS